MRRAAGRRRDSSEQPLPVSTAFHPPGPKLVQAPGNSLPPRVGVIVNGLFFGTNGAQILRKRLGMGSLF